MLTMPRSRQSSVTSSQENLLDRVDHSRSKNSTLTRKNSGIPMFTSPPKTADGKNFGLFYLLFSWFCLRNYFQFFVAAKIHCFWLCSRMIYKKISRICSYIYFECRNNYWFIFSCSNLSIKLKLVSK